MSIRKLSRSIVVDIENLLITHATIVGRFVPCSNDDYMRLARLA
ncbi:hypothetical protein [Desulfurococcus amylolyticus]|nr:hypothetical protein [Desulfurococcus amylolyticus]